MLKPDMENKIFITIESGEPCHHCNQIIVGFLLFAKKYNKKIVVKLNKKGKQPAILKVDYNGNHLIYDMKDGYNNMDESKKLIDGCDFYFKRSFSEKLNEVYFGAKKEKVYPLGLNWDFSCKGNPLNFKLASFKQKIHYLKRYFLGQKNYFLEKDFFNNGFETNKVLFLTRLWEPTYDERYKADCEAINKDRVLILRTLKTRLGNNFVGGYKTPIMHEKYALI